MNQVPLKPGSVQVTNPNFRPNTFTPMKEVVFSMFMEGEDHAALGDMICWMSAIRFIADQYNYVKGHLIVPRFFDEVARNVLSEFPHWRIHSSIPERLQDGFPLRRPSINPVNATAMHLVDLGFIYFAGMMPPTDEARFYPSLDLDEVELKARVAQHPKWAVMTPGATALTRMMQPSAFNAITEALLKKGVMPIFLGTKEVDNGKRKVGINERYDLTKGENLIGQTSLLEAAKIMEKAEMVIGVDNGLLHLAGMTDVPIIFGYTIAGPNQRRVFRKFGHTMEMYGDKEKIPCLFCQESHRFIEDQHFTRCIYQEYEPQCVRALNAESWVAAVEQVLGEH